MKCSRLAMAILCIALFTIRSQAQEKWSRVKIATPADKQSRAQLIGLLQIDHFDSDENGFVVTEISETALMQLKGTTYKFEVLVPDVARHLDSLNQIYYASLNKNVKGKNVLSRVAIEQPGSTLDRIIQKPDAFQVKQTFGGYYSFSEMEAAMNTLVSSYPSIAQKFSIGKTREGRDIWVIKISDNVASDDNEPEILYMGLQHAREAITGASMIFLMQYLCEQYGKDGRIKDLVDNREFFIIPCFNPDGWEYNRSTDPNGGGMWRKNRNPVDSSMTITKDGKGQNVTYDTTYTYTYGVDLNRNWGVDWGNCGMPILGSSTSCGSSSKSVDTYYGPAAFSEAETQAVRNFTKSRNFVAGFDQHAFGPYYSLPFGRQSLHKDQMPQKGKDFYNTVPALMGKYNGMRAADSYDALGYEVAGGFKDWMLMGELGTGINGGRKDTVWAMTGEGGAGNSSNSFWAPAGQIVNLCKGMAYQNLQLAFAAGTYVDIQDASDIALNARTGSLNFKVKRLGLGNNKVNVSLIPLENIIGGGTVTIPSMVYFEDYVGSLGYSLPAGVTNGQRIKFAWKVETDGYSYADTIVKFYNPTVMLTDDMEGSSVTSNWTVSNGWNLSADDKYDGSKSLTESPGGKYTASNTRIATNNNVLNMSGASAAYLTFWTKYRAENFRDKMQVQVSTNNPNDVNSTWTAIAGKNTIQEPGTIDGSTINGQPSLTGIKDYWTQEVFNLEAYKGASTLRFRFVFTSDGDPSSFKYETDDGFYIDNLKVIKSDANFTVLPVEFLNFWGKALADNSVQLIWEANVDDQHHYFEIERSNDGNQFTVLGKLPQMSAFRFVDKSPRSGNNFYRIKQVDKDGTVSYSKIINVYIESTIKVSVYPNPVNDQLIINIGSRNAQNYKIQVTDMQGKVVYDVLKNINSSNTEIKVDTRSWKPQLYILKVINTNNEVVETQKIIKL